MSAETLYDITVESIEHEVLTLQAYQGQVWLVVNTASQCGFTPQYHELEALYQRYAAQGFVVLGFPCNQFASQEPGSNEAIKTFCDTMYHVTFPLFAKIYVQGEHMHPLFKHLTTQVQGAKPAPVRWNFTKFLVDRHGTVVSRYAPQTRPLALVMDIERLL